MSKLQELAKLYGEKYKDAIKKEVINAIGRDMTEEEAANYDEDKLGLMFVFGSVVVMCMHVFPRQDWENRSDDIANVIFKNDVEELETARYLRTRMFDSYVLYDVGVPEDATHIVKQAA